MKTEKSHVFDNPDNIKRLLYALYFCCALLVVLDFVINRKIYHSWENLWAFYPIYGFVGCVLLVFVAGWMRLVLMRDEDYYDPPEAEEPVSSTESVTEEGEHHVRH